MTSEDGWLKVKLDSAESNSDTWVWKDDLTESNRDSQWSNLEIKVLTGMDFMQGTDPNCFDAEGSPVSVRKRHVELCTQGGSTPQQCTPGEKFPANGEKKNPEISLGEDGLGEEIARPLLVKNLNGNSNDNQRDL